MNWKEWCAFYPCLQSKCIPDVHVGEFNDRVDAENSKDHQEEIDSLCFEVVEFQGKFYVVSKNDANGYFK